MNEPVLVSPLVAFDSFDCHAYSDFAFHSCAPLLLKCSLIGQNQLKTKDSVARDRENEVLKLVSPLSSRE